MALVVSGGERHESPRDPAVIPARANQRRNTRFDRAAYREPQLARMLLWV